MTPCVFCDIVSGVSPATVVEVWQDAVAIEPRNPEATQSVFHLHFHLIPIYEGVELGRHGGGQTDPDELRELAAAISAQLH